MNRIAVFGNAGGGKSTLSKRLAEITGLHLVALDLLKYKPGGGEVPHEEYKAVHDQLLQQDQWIVDRFGSLNNDVKNFYQAVEIEIAKSKLAT